MKRTACKIAVIGANESGLAIASRIAERDIADVVLFDTGAADARNAAEDAATALQIAENDRVIAYAKDAACVAGSAIVVIAADNPDTVRAACAAASAHAPESVIVIAGSDTDAAVHAACAECGIDRSRAIGIAGILRAARFARLIAAEASARPSDVEAFVMGGAGQGAVPILSRTTVRGESLTDVLPKPKIETVWKRAIELSGKAGPYSLAAAALKVVEAVIDDSHEVFVVSAWLNGEYGLGQVATGVPSAIGRKGIEQVVVFELDEAELQSFRQSAERARASGNSPAHKAEAGS